MLRGKSGWLVLALACAACATPGPSSPSASISDTGIAGPWNAGGPTGVEWATDARLYVARTPPGTDRQRLYKFDVSTAGVEPLPVDVPEGCRSVDAFLPIRVAELLVFDRSCFATDGPGFHEIIELSPDGQVGRSLLTLPWFPESIVRLPNGSWISGFDSGPCAWIAVAPNTPAPDFAWPIVVSDDGQPFAVDASRDTACDSQPLAHGVARAGDGTLAFVASGAARSTSGLDRMDIGLNLYIRAADGGVERVATGLVEARNVRWSPDGSSITFIARIDGRSAIWRFTRDGQRSALYEGEPLAFAWSPSGGRLAVVISEHSPDADPFYRLILVPVDVGASPT